MRRLFFLATVFGAAAALVVLLWMLATLPPAARRIVAPPAPPEVVWGAYHVHSSRSDGSGSVDDIARAAARAGLQFVILTDHGDGTRPPDAPAYLHGVLVIDAVEVSSEDGHVAAIGIWSAAPYPLGGETRDVIEDIRRLGGAAIAAHPDSPRSTLRWRAGGAVPDGIEWLNADSEWRAHPATTLAATLVRSWFRGPESVAALFGASDESRDRLDGFARSGQVFTLAAVDAHARIGEDVEGGVSTGAWAIAFPGYETMFRTCVQTVALERPPTGEAGADAEMVVAALRRGHSYSVVRAFLDAPNVLQFSATGPGGTVTLGGRLAGDGPATVMASVPPESRARLVLRADGQTVATGGHAVRVEAAPAGAYRVEAFLEDRVAPWIVSNPIWIGPVPAPAPPLGAPVAGAPSRELPLASWVMESGAGSKGSLTRGPEELRFEYHLGDGPPRGQFAALATGASGDTAIDTITFTASSDAPMRVSVQIRLAGGADGQRWRTSIYVDQTPRQYRVPLGELTPVEVGSPLRPLTARVQSVLLVIDTVNAAPGSGGVLRLRDTGFVPAAAGEPTSGR